MIRFSPGKTASLLLALAMLVPLIVTGGNPFASLLPPPTSTIVSVGGSAGLA